MGPSYLVSFAWAEHFLFQLIRNVASVLSMAKKMNTASGLADHEVVRRDGLGTFWKDMWF